MEPLSRETVNLWLVEQDFATLQEVQQKVGFLLRSQKPSLPSSNPHKTLPRALQHAEQVYEAIRLFYDTQTVHVPSWSTIRHTTQGSTLQKQT